VSSALTRWSGLCAVVAGMLFLWGGAGFLAWDYFLEGGRVQFGEPAASTLVFLLNFSVLVLMPLLFFVALVGLRERISGWERTLGGIGLAFAACGSAWRVVSYFVDVYPLYLRFAERNWPPYPLDWILYLLIGLTLIGVGVVRTQSLERWSRLPLAWVASGWVFYVTDFIGTIGVLLVHISSGVLFGLCWVVLGYALWLESGNKNRAS
jgi:hypothetical protein